MAAKPAIPVRLSPEVIEKARAYAESHGVSRQVVYETAIVRFLDGAGDRPAVLVRPSKPGRKAGSDDAAARAEWAANMAARQARLNEAKQRASG